MVLRVEIYEVYMKQESSLYEIKTIYIRFEKKTKRTRISNPISTNPTKWSNTGNSSVTANKFLSAFDHFVELVLKGLKFSTT